MMMMSALPCSKKDREKKFDKEKKEREKEMI